MAYHQRRVVLLVHAHQQPLSIRLTVLAVAHDSRVHSRPAGSADRKKTDVSTHDRPTDRVRAKSENPKSRNC